MDSQKTYWHLMPKKRAPSEYEIVSSKLLYYRERGFEVNVPLKEWYEKYQTGSSLKMSDWERFSDPRELTYYRYTASQSTKEAHLDSIFERIETSGYDEGLKNEWVQNLNRKFGPLRYPYHGLQMVADYLGSMAPSGKLAIAFLFQSANEMRRVQRMAYRIGLLRRSHPHFARDAKILWEQDGLFQPLREAIEKLLVTYDWGEAFVALNCVLSPQIDQRFLVGFAKESYAHGDHHLGAVLDSFSEDSLWRDQWTNAFVNQLKEEGNGETIQAWVEKWQAISDRALRPFQIKS